MKELIAKLTCDTKPELKEATAQAIETALNYYDATQRLLKACGRKPQCPQAKEELAMDFGDNVVNLVTMSTDPTRKMSKKFEEGLRLLKKHLMAN